MLTCAHSDDSLPRQAESPVARAFWLDDANSTGSSLRDGVRCARVFLSIYVASFKGATI